MRKSKPEIVAELKESFNSLIEVSCRVDDALYNTSKNNKWTPAENIAHLVNATKMTTMAYTLPKLIHILLYGKPGRTSHGYSKVVDNYEKKLADGAVATGVYVPKKINYRKDKLHADLGANANKLITAIDNKWSDEQLDHYQVSHPILGLLTVRELAYFTIYHNSHHLETIKTHYLA